MSDGPGAEAPDVDSLRAENERLREELAQREAASPPKERGRGMRRRWVSVTLAVIGSIMVLLTVFTVWTRNQVLNTDRYVATVSPLASDPVIQDALVARATEEVSAAVDFRAIAEDALQPLPPQAQVLAGPIASGAESLVERVARQVVESDAFINLWDEANRAGHEGVVAALTGETGKAIGVDDGQVVLRFGPLAERILNRIVEITGLDVLNNIPADQLNFEFVLIDSDELATAQSVVRLLDRLAVLVAVLAVVCLVGAVFTAPDRRKGLRRVGIGVSVVTVVGLLAFNLGREAYLNNLPDTIRRPEAAAAVYDIMTRFLIQALRTLFAVGLVLLIAAWVTGPGRAAERVRGWWNSLLGKGGEGVAGIADLGPVPKFVSDHLTAIRVGILALAGLVLVTWTRPTGKVVLLLALLAVVALALVQLIAGAARERATGNT